MALEELRTVLLITLSLLAVILLYRRFKQRTMARELPALQHMELVNLEVMYHPVRVRAELTVPSPQELRPAMLNEHHEPLQQWPPQRVMDTHTVLELPIGDQPDGDYFLEIASSSQRTVRRFTLRRA